MRYISGCVSCGIFAIDSHMRGPIGVKLSVIVGANSENVLGPKKKFVSITLIVCRKHLGNTEAPARLSKKAPPSDSF